MRLFGYHKFVYSYMGVKLSMYDKTKFGFIS